MDFGRKTIRAEGHGLSSDRMKALAEIPAPCSKKDVQSLIGLAGQFSQWYPEMVGLTSEIKKLL